MSIGSLECPDDPEALRELIFRQQEQIDEQLRQLGEKSSLIEVQAEELRVLREYIRLLKHQRFGRKSEQSSEAQIRLFNEAEATSGEGDAEEEADDSVFVEAHIRKKRGRKPLPDWIPRVEILHDLPEEQKVCGQDGTALERIGEEVCEQLEFIPAKLRVLRHVRPKYACPTCRTGIHTAPMPPQPIPKSLASPTLLAQVAVSKYADGLPLYRQETMFQRLGIVRPFVVGRKNWLFADTVRGAEASANLYSLIETAKANGLEPVAYLRHVFAQLPGATTLDEVEALLPRQIAPERLQAASHLNPIG